MRTTLDIDADLLRRLRDEAHEAGLSFKEHLNRVLRRGIDAPARTVGPYSVPTFAMGAPLRALDKALALADALEAEEAGREMSMRK